jgi:hypothetical protein
VCIKSLFRDDVSGTLDIVTGTHDNYIRLFSVVSLGHTNEVPCPLCGGFCVGGNRPGAICEGTCSTSGDDCRFDEDCLPDGGTCTTASANCPGGSCNLSLVCFGGNEDGNACRVGAATDFGTTSTDCLPAPGKNISGQGLAISFLPSTSGVVDFGDVDLDYVPCNAPGFELFQCPCPWGGGAGVRTQPNRCAAACDAGAELGQACSDFTKCAGGVNVGRACDQDSDCPGSLCNDTPASCPSGRCVPLCLPTAEDPQEGICAAGPPMYHCSGADHEFRVCTAAEEGTQKLCEAGIDGILGNANDIPGAGTCIADTRNCFIYPIFGEGGDTIKGGGDATYPKSAATYCIAPTANSAINSTAGLGGPGRLRQQGENVPNLPFIITGTP